MFNQSTKSIINLGLAVIILMCSLITAYNMGVKSVTVDQKEPVSDQIRIDDNLININSLISIEPILDFDNNKIGEWIKASYNNHAVYIECLTTKDYTYQEFRSSWLMAFYAEVD